jgi:hypothetical protein
MSADLCGACDRAMLPAGVDEVEAAIRTLRMAAEEGEPRARAALTLSALSRRVVPTCPRCGVRPIQNNGQGSCDTCAQS